MCMNYYGERFPRGISWHIMKCGQLKHQRANLSELFTIRTCKADSYQSLASYLLSHLYYYVTNWYVRAVLDNEQSILYAQVT